MKHKYFVIASIFLMLPAFLLWGKEGGVTDEAQVLYEKHKESVRQIRVINLATGKKSAIGSGFQFSAQGHIATNYHVISDYISRPDQFRVEQIRHDDSSGTLEILDFDVIHDLAIVRDPTQHDSFVELGNSNISKGARIYSMGNPYDLGMTIVEGTFNGFMEKSLYEKILFSGSLNSGMSGGPALNRDGEVLGINVSTMGNQVSFLVPVEYLETLYERVLKNGSRPVKDWDKYIEDQLVDNQKYYINELLSSKWESRPLGDAYIPGEISKAVKCWGGSKDDGDEMYNSDYVNCFNEDSIYITSSHSTGSMEYKYNWITSDKLNPFRFYNLYESYFSFAHRYGNADEKDAEKFICNTDFVLVDGVDSKMVLCARNYKKYPKLFDVNLSIASVEWNDKGLLTEVAITGVTKDNAIDIVRRFIREIKWKK